MARTQHKQRAEHEKRQDLCVTSIIHQLDLFIAQAASADMGRAARILHQAKEELVLWAVDEGFHETAEERFINRHVYNNSLFAVADFITRLCALKEDKRLGALFAAAESEASPYKAMEALRKAM